MVATFDDQARMLARYGVITKRIFRDDAMRQRWEARVFDALDECPEFKVKGRDAQRVLGGFGALGNPSSFHHPTIRDLRRLIKREITTPLFEAYARQQGLDDARLEMLYDRVCVRAEAFGNVTEETWHRDIYDGAKHGLRALPSTLDGGKRDDEIFGGWVNLSDQPQRFVGIAGAHRGQRAATAQRQGGGFASLTPEQVREERVEERLARQANHKFGSCRCDEKGHIIVPPGHMVLFYQRLLHSVAKGSSPKTPNLRLFLGNRLTCEHVSLFENLDRVIENNAVPRIPSGQMPPMYSVNHYMFFSKDPKYRDWAARTFDARCLFQRMTKDGTFYFTPGSRDDVDPHANKGRYMPSPPCAYSSSTATRTATCFNPNR